MRSRPPGYENSVAEAIAPEALEAMREVQRSGHWPLVLSGPTGTGKTSAAAVLYGTWHQMPMWHRADDFLLSISTGRVSEKKLIHIDTVNHFGQTVRRGIKFDSFLERVTECHCLFLDDLGTRTPTEPMYGALYDLLEWRKDKPVCITTNKTVPELAAMFDDRVASRLAHGTIVMFSGADRRERGQLIRVPGRRSDSDNL